MTVQQEAEALVGDWIRGAAPGTRCAYYEGWLMSEREGNPEADAMASALLAASDCGYVHLTQAKLGFQRYRYYATRAWIAVPRLAA